MVALQAALWAAIDRWPQIRYPEYGLKLARLREQLAESPGRPLVLVIGSSRSGVGLDPRQFSVDECAEQPPLIFNFALSGAGPIQHLMLLRTLLHEGLHPQRLLLELHPLFLNQGCGALREECRIDVHQLDDVGLETLAQYTVDPCRLRRQWWEGRLLAAFGQRHHLLDYVSPRLCSRFPQYGIFRQINSWGWLAFPNRAKNEESRKAMAERARGEYRDCFPRFSVTHDPDRALRCLLDLCRSEGIRFSMYLMPEGSEFRACYPQGARRQVDDYLSRLQTEYGFDLHDLTTSMPDESFADSHHLLPEAVARFSTIFAREVVASVPFGADRTAAGTRAVVSEVRQ
jgi:hypothetical protein